MASRPLLQILYSASETSGHWPWDCRLVKANRNCEQDFAKKTAHAASYCADSIFEHTKIVYEIDGTNLVLSLSNEGDRRFRRRRWSERACLRLLANDSCVSRNFRVAELMSSFNTGTFLSKSIPTADLTRKSIRWYRCPRNSSSGNTGNRQDQKNKIK